MVTVTGIKRSEGAHLRQVFSKPRIIFRLATGKQPQNTRVTLNRRFAPLEQFRCDPAVAPELPRRSPRVPATQMLMPA